MSGRVAHCLWTSLLGTTLIPLASAAPPQSRDSSELAARQVELFAAMDEGTIRVQLIPKNAERARILIENRTKQPLRVQLPETFAGVPVLAQVGGGGLGGGGGRNSSGGGGSSQGLGGGLGGGGGGGGFGGGGFFSVPPEKTGKLAVATLCLDHGRPDPNPKIPYAIVPLEQYVDQGEVIELVKAFGSGKLDPMAAQAAAWHLRDNVSWRELASKTTGSRRLGTLRPYFQRGQLTAAMAMAQAARHEAQVNGTVGQVAQEDPDVEPSLQREISGR